MNIDLTRRAGVVGGGWRRATALRRLCRLNVGRFRPVSKIYAVPPFSVGTQQRPIVMVQPYFREEPRVWRAPAIAARPGDPAFIVATNIVAGWLMDIAGPFFCAALIMLFALAEMAPR